MCNLLACKLKSVLFAWRVFMLSTVNLLLFWIGFYMLICFNNYEREIEKER